MSVIHTLYQTSVYIFLKYDLASLHLKKFAFVLSSPEHMLREGKAGEERGREKPRYERETFIGCLVAQPGIEPTTFQSVGQRSNQLSHTSQGPRLCLNL